MSDAGELVADQSSIATQQYEATPEQAFRVGRVIGASFSVLFKNFGPFFLLAVLVVAPLSVVSNLFLTPGNMTVVPGVAADGVIVALAGILSWLLSLLLTAGVTYGAYRHLTHEPVALGDLIKTGLPLIIPVMAVSILSSLAISAASLLLLIPGIIVACMYAVAVPVVVIERPGILASLTRSSELTEGLRWRVFAIVAVIFVLSFVLGFVTNGVLAFMMATGDTIQLVTGLVINVILEVVTGVFFAVTVAVMYFHLRVAKEGTDVDQIASVFD